MPGLVPGPRTALSRARPAAAAAAFRTRSREVWENLGQAIRLICSGIFRCGGDATAAAAATLRRWRWRWWWKQRDTGELEKLSSGGTFGELGLYPPDTEPHRAGFDWRTPCGEPSSEKPER